MSSARIPTIQQTPRENQYRAITPGAILGRLVALSLAMNVAVVTMWGKKIPGVETAYDTLGWLTVGLMVGAFLFPKIRALRFIGVAFVFFVFLARTFWWLLWSHNNYTFSEAMVPAVTYFTIVLLTFTVTMLAELIEGMR